ncbi:hypothetical protein [Nonomuraea sp. NPDC050310]|uniref:hypothetical protein n=1 Tax=unclassified Nonomuraea TaxID=2593643 RepID=UPI0033F846F2
MSDTPSEIGRDYRATLDARRDLGPEYETALAESFADRLDQVIAARVQAEIQAAGPSAKKRAKTQAEVTTTVAIASLGLGIPLTAIAAGTAGPLGLLIAWIGIAVVNIAVAVGNRR